MVVYITHICEHIIQVIGDQFVFHLVHAWELKVVAFFFFRGSELLACLTYQPIVSYNSHEWLFETLCRIINVQSDPMHTSITHHTLRAQCSRFKFFERQAFSPFLIPSQLCFG
jgi:hypothetical protein